MRERMRVTGISLMVMAIWIAVSSCDSSRALSGTYINTDTKALYNSIEFKGATSCIITSGMVEGRFAAGYTRDGNLIRIASNDGDLLFTMKDQNTLVGDGLAKGTYVRK